MYGDTTTIRALAGRLHERADEIRDLAATLRVRTDQVPWTGLAADAMRAHVGAGLARRLGPARRPAHPPPPRRRPPREVDRLKGLLLGAKDLAEDLAGDLAGDLAEGAIDGLRGLLT